MKVKRIATVFVIVALLVSSSVLIFLYLGSRPQPENQAPEITIVNPLPGSTVTGVTMLNISVVDEENLTATIFIDGTNVTRSNLYEWATTEYPDGKHTIRVGVSDSLGKYAGRSIEVSVDNVDEVRPPFDGLFKIMEYNIKESGKNNDWKTVVKQENPDILIVVETGFWDDNANESLNAAVSELNAYFEDEYPYEAYCAQNTRYSTTGEAILSRFPVLEFNQIPVVPLDNGDDYYVTHDFIEAVVDINGTAVHVFGGHLKASGGETNIYRREVEMEGIINYMDALGNVPILYLSDQNSFSPADTGDLAPEGMELGYGPMTMMLYPNDTVYGNRSSNVHNFTDVYRALNPAKPGHTYGHRDGAVSFRIDYIVANRFFLDSLVNSTVVDEEPAYTASDHYAVTAFINWNATDMEHLSACKVSSDSDTASRRIVARDTVVRSPSLLMCTAMQVLRDSIMALPRSSWME
jgi:endonuclease/exonuclease/phosphatase family metal-dependent hydrolase